MVTTMKQWNYGSGRKRLAGLSLRKMYWDTLTGGDDPTLPRYHSTALLSSVASWKMVSRDLA